MAGNIVKWWKHKILGGYKQFSVQECNTDSEELVQQQVRAASSCSAPPDLLLVSEREHGLNKRATASSSEANLNGNNANNHPTHNHNQNLSYNHHHQQLSTTTKSTKEATLTTTKHSKNDFNASTKCKTSKLVDIDTAVEDNIDHTIASATCKEQQAIMPERQGDCVGYEKDRERDDRLLFEEFTCDVSVEGGKSSKPLQFSFTFYDLDGHHGKITKDDIVGIVYTIYESIGKSVVVPHYGSKTINVRLTFSPESKTKSSANVAPNNNGGDSVDGKVAATNTNGVKSHGRRQHRYRPRKLIKSEDEDDDSQSDKEKENNNIVGGFAARSSSHKSKQSKHIGKLKLLEQFQQKYSNNEHQNNSQSHSAHTNTYTNTNTLTQSINNDSIYDNINLENLKCCAGNKDSTTNVTAGASVILEGCSGCGIKLNGSTSHSRHIDGDYQNKQTPIAGSTRVKVSRRVRNKQKQQDQHCAEHRQRSLSVGNEICYKNRHLTNQQLQHEQLQQQIPKQTQNSEKVEEPTMLDGVQLRHPQKDILSGSRCQKRNSAECWKSALNRNDLISIIRESMEKNRLCFQLNEKPQANVTPIRQMQHHRASLQQQHQQQNNTPHQQSQQRLRANTVSKIPTLIAHHSNSYVNNNSNLTINNNINNNSRNNNNNNIEAQIGYEQNHSSHASLCQLQPHIPIYHQQMAINPAVLAAQNNLIGHRKMNPCGYDSFLHATICTGGGGSVSTTPLPPTTPTIAMSPTNMQQQHDQVQQPIAAVLPTLNASCAQDSKISNNGSASHQIKLSKVLRSGAYSQNYHNYHSGSILNATSPAAQNTAQNSPQYRGYQRLATQHNLPALHLQASTGNDVRTHNEKRTHIRDRCLKSRQSVKYNESLVYAKLREDLQENIFNTGGEHVLTSKPKSQMPHRKHATHKLGRHSDQQLQNCATGQQPPQEQQQQPFASGKVDYVAILGMNGQVDAIECENLLDEQTSDEEFNSEEVPTPNGDTDITLAILESEDTLPTPSTVTHTNNSIANNVTSFTEPLIDLNDDNAECKLNAELTAADLEADGDLEDIEDDVEGEVDLRSAAEAIEDEDDDIENVADNLIANNNNNGHSHLSPSSSRAALASTTINNTSNANNTANTSNASASSLIHRCVHEHIHHHYHHFEKKDE